MATTTKKNSAAKSKATQAKAGAGPAIAERSKDAKKPTFGKAAPKTVKSTAPKTTKTAAKRKSEDGGIASTVFQAVKDTAKGAVALAASVIGRDGKTSTKSKSH
jgi:hypothetical protein